MADLVALAVPATKAASTLFVVFCVGLLAGHFPRPHGLLTPATVRTLAACVLWLFSPALLFSTFGRTLTPAVLRAAAAAGIWSAIHIAVAVPVALLFRRLAAPPPAQAGAFTLAVVWGNCLSLPLLLLTSLTARGTLRDDATAFARAVQYIFVYTIPWWVSMYSIGYELARRSAEAARGAGGAAAGAPIAPPATARAALARALLQPPIVALALGVVVGLTPLAGLFFGAGAPLAGLGDVATLLGGGSVPSANLVLAGSLFGGVVDALRDARAWLGEAPPPAAGRGALADAADAARVFARAAARAWGERGGRRAAIGDGDASEAGGAAERAGGKAGGDLSEGSGAAERTCRNAGGDLSEGSGEASPVPLVPAGGAAGAAAPPGARAAALPADADADADADAPARLSASTMAVIIAARLLVCPALNFLLFAAAQAARVPLLTSDDPVLSLVVLVQSCMPSAQTLLVVLANVGDERGGRSISMLFIVMYPMACVFLVPWLMAALELAGLNASS